MTPWQSAPVLAAIEACERPVAPSAAWLEGKRIANAIINATPSPRPVVAALLRDVAAGIRVLRTYGVEITEEQVMERASNIVTGLIGNYRIEEE